MTKKLPVEGNNIHTLVEEYDITIWWTYNSWNDSMYLLQYKRDADTGWQSVPYYPIEYDASITYNNLFYKYVALQPNTIYNFRIKVKGLPGSIVDDSEWSTIVSEITSNQTSAPPTNLLCETVSDTNNIKLIWDDISILYGLTDETFEIQINQPNQNSTWLSVFTGVVDVFDIQGVHYNSKIIQNLLYSTSYKFRVKRKYSDWNDSPWTESQIIITPACLLKGTKVRTIQGFKNIENIKVGDFIISHLRVPVRVIKTHNWKVKWSNKMHKASKVYVLENYKSKTFLSSYHKLMVDNEMVCACNSDLRLARKEEICDKNNEYELFHIQVEDHENNHLLVNGDNIVESWDGKFSY
jgi:hypothetical protein